MLCYVGAFGVDSIIAPPSTRLYLPRSSKATQFDATARAASGHPRDGARRPQERTRRVSATRGEVLGDGYSGARAGNADILLR